MSRTAHTEEDIAQALEDLKALQVRPAPDRPHVCGNCRNPWTKYGREDCPNNIRSSVRLLTGATDAEMNDLGGFSDETKERTDDTRHERS